MRASRSPVCEGCLHALWLPSQDMQVCGLCGESMGMESVRAADLSHTAPAHCRFCVASPPRFRRAVSFGTWDDLAAPIGLMKFDGVPALARPLGNMLAHAIAGLAPAAPDAMLVVPVPLFRGKRSFNQSTLMAQHALRRLRATHPGWSLTLAAGLLVRTRHTASQYLLTRGERRRNLRGAFAVQGTVAGCDILLVDDVYTTGATVRECSRVLHAAGAKSITVATLARVQRDAAVFWQPGVALHSAGATAEVEAGTAARR